MGTQEADDCQSACRHPQVHHNTECRAPEGNRAGQDSYGFKLKAYAPRLLDKVEHKAAGINSLILERTALPEPEFLTEANIRQLKAARKFIARKQRQYDIQNREFPDMQPDPKPAEYLDNATFVNKDYETCQFTHLQKHDLNLVLQKRYALLNWQQGSGKTAAAYHRAKYLLNSAKCAMSSYWLPPSPST